MIAIRRFTAWGVLLVAMILGSTLFAPTPAFAAPPQTTITAGPGEDRITTDTTPTFRFASSQAGSTFECRLNGGAYAPCTSPHTVGPLADGDYLFEVRATNGSAETDATPAQRSFTVDHDFVPETEITSGPGTGTTTSDDTPTFEFRATTGGRPVAYPFGTTTFTCSIDGGPWFACTSPYTTPSLANGLHTFAVRATFQGRTDATPDTRTFTIDRGIPETSITGGPTEGSVTADETPTFSFASDRAGATFACSVDGQAPFACSSPVTIGPLANGSHTFSVAATVNGRTDPSAAQRTFTIAVPSAAPQPAGAPAPLPPSQVRIFNDLSLVTIGGRARIELRCSAGSGECAGTLRLVRTIWVRRASGGFAKLRRTFATQAFMVPSGGRLVVRPRLTLEARRLLAKADLRRLTVLTIADTPTTDSRRVVLLVDTRNR